MIALQIAVTLVLALGGALLVVSGARVLAEETGFDVDRTLALTVHIGAGSRQTTISRLDALIEAVRREPVVQQVGVLDAAFMKRGNATPPVEWPEHARHVRAEGVMVASGFFQVAGLELVSGRYPTADELDSGERLAVVSEQVARGFWPDRPAVGQTLQGAGWAGRSDMFRIVGVVRDARLQALDMEPYGQIYLPIRVFGVRRAPTILVRTSPGAHEAVGTLVATIDALGFPYSLQRIEPLGDRVRDSVRIRVFQAWLFGSFAISALVIAALGVFGLIAMAVGHRSREIAIRIALGSTRRKLVRLLVLEQVSAVVAGLVGGSIAAGWVSRLLTSYVYQITVYDPQVWIATIAVVMISALFGALVPSWRASRLDPVHALRDE